MNGLADIFSAEPDLAKEIAAIQDQDLANERLRRLADERGVVWRERRCITRWRMTSLMT